MAVTAPTYVLEESLSSQRLWKDTAGNRPPQPFEERAFYEKMWAQNFVKSQVDYTAPMEVLTASSPVYLSPFADANFDSGANDHHAHVHTSNYDTMVQPPTRGDTSGNATDATLAEATLIHRLQDPRSTDVGQSGKVAGTSISHGHHDPGVVGKTVKGTESEGDLTVLIRGDNVFGTTVSKSFAKTYEKGGSGGVDTVNISVASYRVVESKKYGKYAQFLVIYREGSIRDTVGVWKRYSDFVELSRKVTETHEGCTSVLANMSPLAVTEEHEQEHLPNAITSWKLLKKRQRWYRCLDAGYLSLKVFLLERFLHDILFESSSPNLLRDFALNPKRLVSSKPSC
jgi:hypothetical protein